MKQVLKQKHIENIMEAVIKLEVVKGHLKWRMTDLARTSGVTRSLLYYYFGQDKTHIFHEAVQYYITEFFDFRLERAEKIKKGEIVDLIATARNRFRKTPYLLRFYAQHRLEATTVSSLFERAERQYYENLKQSLPKRWHPFARVLWAFVFGLAIQPNLSDEELKTAEAIMRRAWPKDPKKL